MSATLYPPRTWLRELRGDRTFRELIAGSKFGSGYLSSLERGVSSPKIATVPALAALYGIDPFEMVCRFLAEQPIGSRPPHVLEVGDA